MPGKSSLDLNYKKLTDEELILLFQKEDVSAYNELVDRYMDKIVNFLYRYTGSREESEDVAQEAFINVYRSKHLYRDFGKFSSWFYRIAINIAKNHINKNKRLKTISINNAVNDNEQDYEIPDNISSPERDTDSSIESYYIQKAIESLNPKFREVIILRDIQDMEYEEICAVTKLPMGTVKSRINRGRECLKEILEHIYKQKAN